MLSNADKMNKTHKKCNMCLKVLLVSNFTIVRRNEKTGTIIYSPKCKPCNNIITKRKYHELSDEQKLKRRNRNKEKFDKKWHKNWKLENKYGFNINDFNLMCKKQKNKCYICSKSFNNHRKIQVDHNHKTGKLRKLLCRHCNTALGFVEENTNILYKMIEYLNEHD